MFLEIHFYVFIFFGIMLGLIYFCRCYFILVYYLNIEKTPSTCLEYLKLFFKKDFSLFLQRIIIVKFLFLYVYITSGYTYCNSCYTTAMHNAFVYTGVKMGIEPHTTISTLETIGMITVAVGVTYCGIKGYQYLTAVPTLPKPSLQNVPSVSSLTSLDMEQIIVSKSEISKNRAMNNLTEQVLELKNQVEQLKEQYNDAQSKFTTLNSYQFGETVKGFDVTNTNICLLREEVEHIKKTLYPESLITVSDKYSLDSISDELKKLIRVNGDITYHSGSSQISKHILSSEGTLGILPANICKPKVNKVIEKLNKPKEATYTITEISDTQIVLTAVTSELKNVLYDLADHTSKRVLKGINLDVLLRFLSKGVTDLLEGTLSGASFLSFLEIFGFNITSVPSSLETVGSIIVNVLNEFIEMVKRELK